MAIAGFPENRPLAAWTARELIREAGFADDLSLGRVQIAESGEVTVRGTNDAVRFAGLLRSREDLDRLMTVLGECRPSAASKNLQEGDTLSLMALRLEETRVAQRANDRIWFGSKLVSGIDERYVGGRAFSLPLVELPPGRGRILKMTRKSELMDRVARFFERPNGGVAIPVHPQEMPFRHFGTAANELAGARCASSERTVHVNEPELEDVLLKLDLAHITHSLVTRPIEEQNAIEVIAKTGFLMNWLDRYSAQDCPAGRLDPFCFFPEAMALVDTKADAAVVVRALDPYPPLPGGKKSWSLPLYALTAIDQDFPNEPPMLVRLIRDREDKSQSPLDYFEAAFLRPLIGSAMRLCLDLGASCQAHAQNTSIEFGEDGQLTGRVVHQDLEDLWPRPNVARKQGRPSLYDETSLKPADAGGTIDPAGTFEDFFHSQNLDPLVACFAEHFPAYAQDAETQAIDILCEEIGRRRPLISKMSGFSRYLR
jgi:hypothetical protein